MQVYKEWATLSCSTSSKKEYELKNPLLDVTMVANKCLSWILYIQLIIGRFFIIYNLKGHLASIWIIQDFNS
jgi:hypothetical protein